MVNTYNYLKTVFQKLRQENNSHPSIVFVVLMLWCIPLSYKYSSIALILFTAYTLYNLNKNHFHFQRNLAYPIALFGLMALSLVWTHDTSASLRALSKGLPLLLVPLNLMFLKPITAEYRQKTLRYFSFGMVAFALFYLLKAAVRFALTQNPEVFFYHELVTEDVNAIHVSVYVAVANFHLITRSAKSIFDKIAIAILTILLVLLSSKNVIVIFFVLVGCYYLWHFRSPQKKKILAFGGVAVLVVLLVFSGKIKDRFRIEYESNVSENSLNYDIGTDTKKVYNVSIYRAWTADKFRQNDFFPGTAFRVYQLRIFTEMLREDSIFFTGYGLNASDFKIAAKRVEHQLYEGYEQKNFHNEYVQLFAELGIFGLLLLLIMVSVNLKNALKSKDFTHISFAVLMISLFLTESFLSRQRGIIFFTIMYCLFNAGNLTFRPQKQ